MPNIRLDLDSPISTGQSLVFKSPADCSQITGLIIYYPVNGNTQSTEFQFADAHGNNVGDIDLFAENAFVKVVLDIEHRRAYVQNADTNAYIEKTFVKVEAPVYTANPENVLDVIKSAQEGATVQLEDGVYDTLVLKGQKAYPENLTIIGSRNAKVDGISITSGVENTNLLWASDVVNTIMPGDLTIEGLTLTKSFSLRNASIDGLNIVNCHITSGGINFVPNSFVDQFGKDGTASTANRFSFQKTEIKNILIKKCTIDYVNKDKDKSRESNSWTNHAIYFQSGENITIQSNTINEASSNGMQLTRLDATRPLRGHIRISNNTINKSTESAIRVAGIVDGLLTVVNNKLYNCSVSGGVDSYIYVTACTNTSCIFRRREADGYNSYEGNRIVEGDGILLGDSYPYLTPANIADNVVSIVATGTTNGLNWRKWSNGDAEVWGEITGVTKVYEDEYEDGYIYRTERSSFRVNYPFTIYGASLTYTSLEISKDPEVGMTLNYDLYKANEYSESDFADIELFASIASSTLSVNIKGKWFI